MCGLLGAINLDHAFKNRAPVKSYMADALYMDTLRGPDSTGIFVVHKNKNIEVFKHAVDGAFFIQHNDYTDIMVYGEDYKVLVGHNRKATKGSINTANAHPFTHKHITMCHNGTLFSYKELHKKNFNTDSETVCAAMAQTKDPKELLEKLDGSYVLLWYNTSNGRFYMARNDDRPLHAGVANGGKNLYFMSELGMLRSCAGRNQITIEQEYNVPSGTLFSWDVHNIKDVSEFQKEKFTPYKPSYTYSNNMTGAGNHNQGARYRSSGYGSGVSSIRSKEEEKIFKTLDIKPGDYVTFTLAQFTQYYPGTDRGYFEGYSDGYDFGVQVHRRFKDSFGLDEEYTGKVAGINHTASMDGWPVITIDNVILNPSKGDDVKRIEDRSEEAPSGPPVNFQKEDSREWKGEFYVRGPNGLYWTRADFMDAVKDGCVCCGGILPNPDFVHWNHAGAPLCFDCRDEIDEHIMGRVH